MSTPIRERALALLGAGVPATTVAASLGVTPAVISQLLSEDEFSSQVTELRCAALAKHNERDGKYDSLEDKLLERLDKSVPLMHKPMEILKSLQVVNMAKRRGASSDTAIAEKQTIVQLVVPIQLQTKFQVNLQGQVTTVDGEDFTTIQSSSLDTLARKRLGNSNDTTAGITGKNSSQRYGGTGEKEAACGK